MTRENTPITKFFANQTIFLTGGTGFIGKLIVEKLLRECWDIGKIYVLMRSKKNKTPQQRFEEFFQFPCFNLIKHKNMKEKVSLISGDCDKPRLGLSPEDFEILRDETTCVIHAAANVKFDQSLKEASKTIAATREVVELSKKMLNLKALVYISTAYSNANQSHIKEEIYQPPLKAETLLDLVEKLDDETLDKITPILLGKWPNTYVYTKCICEDLVGRSAQVLPTAIVRPAIITNTIEEPLEGWVDNIYGFIGVGLGMHLGVVRSFYANKGFGVDLVPADYVCNCILAVIWKTAVEKSNNAQIYNCVGKQIPIEKASYLLQKYYWHYPSEKYICYKSFSIRSNIFWHNAYNFSLGLVVHFVNFTLKCLGKPTNAVQKFKNMNRMMLLLSYFTTSQWEFDEDNINRLKNEMSDEDKKIFKFHNDIDWSNYIRICCLGMRLYLLKDPIETLPKGQRKIKILFAVHYTLLALTYFLTYMFFRNVYKLWR